MATHSGRRALGLAQHLAAAAGRFRRGFATQFFRIRRGWCAVLACAVAVRSESAARSSACPADQINHRSLAAVMEMFGTGARGRALHSIRSMGGSRSVAMSRADADLIYAAMREEHDAPWCIYSHPHRRDALTDLRVSEAMPGPRYPIVGAHRILVDVYLSAAWLPYCYPIARATSRSKSGFRCFDVWTPISRCEPERRAQDVRRTHGLSAVSMA